MASGMMGAMGAVCEASFFDLRKSNSAMLFSDLRYLQRFFQLAGVKQFVKQLYHLLGPQLDHAHAGAHQALLDDGNALLELGAVLLKLLVGQGAAVGAGGREERAERATSPLAPP